MSKFIWTSIATCGGLGFSPKAPGTVASAVALIFWAYLKYIGLSIPILGILCLLLLVLGRWASAKMESYTGKEDASQIVIDEWVGVGISLLASNFSAVQIIAAFILFRIFDITKPPGVRFFDRRSLQSWGVMLDDVVAGLYAMILVGAYNVFLS